MPCNGNATEYCGGPSKESSLHCQHHSLTVVQIGLTCTSMVAAQVTPLVRLPVLLNQLHPPVPAVLQVFQQDGIIRDAGLIMPMGVYLMFKNQTPRHSLLNHALQLVWLLALRLQVWNSVFSASVVMLLLMAAFSRTPIQNAQLPALAITKKNVVLATGSLSTPEGSLTYGAPLVLRQPVCQAHGPIKAALREWSSYVSCVEFC